MRKLFTLFFFLLCISFTNSGQTTDQKAMLDVRNSVRIGPTTTIQSRFKGLPLVEPHVSAHPSNNNHLLVAAMVVTDINNPYQSCRLSSFVSSDGGYSWKETTHDMWGYDPCTAILSDGKTVMSWLGTPQSFKHQFPLQIFNSADGGITWEKDFQTITGDGHGHDGTKVVALGNEFYCTTVRFNNAMGADVVLLRKEGSGSFEEVAKIDGKGKRLNFCEPVILTDGTVVVPASDFQKKIWVQLYNHTTGNLSDPYNFSFQPGGAKGYMRLLADVNPNSKFKDRVYFVRALGAGSNYSGIWMNFSADGGKVWSKDKRVDLFQHSFGSKAMVPSVAVNKNGVIGISWVDSQNESNQKGNDVYFTVSLDGGLSFQRPVRVTKKTTDPKTEGNGDVANKFPGGGHYLGITTKVDGSFQLVWSDSRSGIFELQTCNITVE